MNQAQKSAARWTVRDVLQWTTEYFGKKGVQTARLDAEVLLAHCLGVDRLYLYLHLDRPLLPDERSKYRGLVARRAAREPVALITGRKEFWSIPMRVVNGVLIPRPETEILVEAVLEEIRLKTSPLILEIGTGSGAITVAIMTERPDAWVVATDVNRVALETALLNSRSAEVEPSLVASELFSALKLEPVFDVICSNPPYIPADAIPTLAPEICRYEPCSALDGGPDGLDVVRRITAEARRFLKENGALIMEIGDGQEEAVRELLNAAGFGEIKFFPDLAGITRVAKGKA
ncbi:MAG: peptide chain release factor N(5)-glutamine methyltransferase [Desulfomonile tiedjei]|nr:peptide chain release factor N(5)-glutamine methyltransferase [Desulfomonile tiedjei]